MDTVNEVLICIKDCETVYHPDGEYIKKGKRFNSYSIGQKLLYLEDYAPVDLKYMGSRFMTLSEHRATQIDKILT